MFTKSFALIFVAIFAFQAVEAKPLESREERALGDAIKALLEKIAKLFESAVQQATAVFGKLIEKIKEVASALLEQGKDKLKDLIEKLKAKIAELVAGAEAIGVDVKECVVDQEEQFKKLFENLQTASMACVDDKIAEAQAIVANAQAEFQEVSKAIFLLKDRFEGCDGFGCYLGVANDAYKLFKSLPLRAKAIIDNVKALVGEIIADVPSCLGVVVENVSQEGQLIQESITQCISDKINNHINNQN